MGICNTFHRNVAAPTEASFPVMRSDHTACIHATTSWSADIPASARTKGHSHSGFWPVRSRSMKIREKAGLITPNRELMSVVSATNTSAVPAPVRRFFA